MNMHCNRSKCSARARHRRHLVFNCGIGLLLMCGLVASGEVKVTVAHNDSQSATAAFSFTSIPSPSKDDAASRGKFTIADGAADENGAGVEALNDGIVPDKEDQPDQNFFFDGAGGRL